MPTARAVSTGSLIRALPTAVAVLLAILLSWRERGSIDAADWLPYGACLAVVLAAVLLSGVAVRPSRRAGLGLAALGLLALWQGLSAAWSPLPGLARDDALLSLFYAGAAAVPLVTIRCRADRVAATAIVVIGIGGLCAATALHLRLGASPDDAYWFGRLNFPVSYPNGVAALALVGFWPAIGLAAELTLPRAVRALGLGAAAAMLSVELLAQSKGAAVGLVAGGVVFFAVSPSRLRALVPTAVVAILAAAAFRPLTAPYRAETDPALAAAIARAGSVALLLVLAGVVAGAAYGHLDRRLAVPARASRIAGFAVAGALAVAVAGSLAVAVTRVGDPGQYVRDRWQSFRTLPAAEDASSHLTSLGSNRYDFWRVALDAWQSHPVQGVGARGWAAEYLRAGRSAETPARAHSLAFDTLAEDGLVGILLLAAAGLLLLRSLVRRSRDTLLNASLLASGVYWAVHTSVDWAWTIPAVGVPAALLIGIGVASEADAPLDRRQGLTAGIAVLAAALLLFVPPWLSGRFVDRAYGADSASAVAADLRWARRLDPLSTEPYVAEAAIAGSPGDVAPLRRAVAKHPRDAELHYLLGAAYLRAGRRAAARRELQEALRLSPRDPLIRRTLAAAR